MRRLSLGLASAVIGAWLPASAVLAAPADNPISLDRYAEVNDSAEPQYLQIVNPADKQREFQHSNTATTLPAGRPAPGIRLRSYEMPPIEVVGDSASPLREEDRIGPNQQPRWTAQRRFPATRVYVIPPGNVEFEYWLRPQVPRDGKTKIRSLYELEFGLPNRMQLDLYFRTESESDGPTATGQSIELRYAFADWNKIWGNPTIYVEWTRMEDEPDAIEVKLLLGGEIAPGWHWGFNLSDELQTGGARENEIKFTAGVSYTVIDSVFSVGLETECFFVDEKGSRGSYQDTWFLGPSIQYRPLEQMHIDFAPLFGLTGDSPLLRAYLVIGWEF